jgi:hypothetical protein
MLIGTLGLIVICLLRTPLRWGGVVLLALAAAFAAAAPRPDVFVSGDGEAVAVRRADGRFAVLKSASQSFAPRDWLGADGDAREEKDPDLASGFSCDPVGCIARLADGTIVAVALTARGVRRRLRARRAGRRPTRPARRLRRHRCRSRASPHFGRACAPAVRARLGDYTDAPARL